MKAVFVTGSLVHGGAERHSITVMNRLAERGHECHAIYIKDDKSQFERIRLRGRATVRCLDAARYFDTRALTDFAADLARIGPAVIVAANPYALMYASLARSRSRLQVPLVATFHSTRLLGMKEHLKMLAYRWFFWTADCAVFVCEAQRLYWRRRGVFSRRNEVIYNGVDTDLFSDKWTAAERAALRSALGFAGTDYVIGISAVLRPEKNHVQLVDAIAGLRNMGLPARALMIGDGATRGAVEARARELNVVRDIQITGFQQEVRPHIAASDVMALCSLTEAFSLAALEAMALRRAVVHSDVGGAAEMIFPGRNGFLFPAGNTSAFIGKLAILADRTISRHMGRNAREMVEARFSEATMIDRYEQVLLDICRPALRGGERSAGTKAAQESARVGLHMDERKRR